MQRIAGFFWQFAARERPKIGEVMNFRPNFLSRAAAIPLAPVLLVQATVGF